MTERRPHWDDELVDAVIHEIGVLRPSPPPLANTAYAVIAAVEDWARWEHVPKGTLRRIQRVRELHRMHCGSCKECMECNYLMPCPTIRALDVPCPTCSGPIRETVGLVCQTCGTDYGGCDE